YTYDIQLDIQATIEILLKRLNSTNNYRLELILVLLQVANEVADYITQPEKVPRLFSGKTVLEQEKTALQISNYFNYFEATLSEIYAETEIQQEYSKTTELIILYKNRKYIELLKLGSYIDQELQYIPTQYWYYKKITKYQFSTKGDKEIYKEFKKDSENYISKLRQIKNFGYMLGLND
ncbi:22957_t:CDS:2, partial [Racocetra persica]